MENNEKIIIDLEMREKFRTEVDVKKVQLALAVVLEQASFDQSELDGALQIIEDRADSYNINFNTADMNNQGYDPFGFYVHDEDEDGEPIDGWTNY